MEQHNWRRLQAELGAYVALRGRTDIRLAVFLREQAIEVDDLYRSQGRSGWANLKRDVGLPVERVERGGGLFRSSLFWVAAY